MKSFTIKTLFLFCVGVFYIFTGFAQGRSNIILENADSLVFDKQQSSERQVLIGNVQFRHEDALMFCDSAYFYSKQNSLDAFGNVRMEQGDTLFVYGDVLYYNGNRNMARLRKNVRMVNRETVLSTDSLNYDRARNVGYYFNGGQIKDSTNLLVSERGYYFPRRRIAEFKNDVVLTNPDFNITSDTLKYNTFTKVAYLLGPSDVNHVDTHIYSEFGEYNTETQYASLFERSLVENGDGKSLIADTIYYDQLNGIGRIYRNAEIKDSIQKMILRGNIGYYDEKIDHAFMTDNALAIEYSSGDSLFIHADTMYYTQEFYKIIQPDENSLMPLPDSINNVAEVNLPDGDSLPTDSTYNLLKAFRHVRFFRTDIQGKCDSMLYSTQDSIMSMYKDPVVWSDNNQLSGNLIQAFMRDGTIDFVYVQDNALAIMQDVIDTTKYSQLIGKEIKGYIVNNALHKVDVSGNTQSIYYPREEDGTLVGVNKTESSFLTAYLKNNKIDKIVLYPASSGKIRPVEDLTKEDVFFPNFVWRDDIRPKKMEDIYLKFEPVKDSKEERRRRRRQ